MTGRGAIAEPFLRVTGISKRFGETQALRDVGLEAIAGEVHAIVGENGAGKSTLLRILSGAEQPDEGHIWVEGQRVTLGSPIAARRLGIRAVYQELSLVPHLSVAENILMERFAGRRVFLIDPREVRAQAAELLDELGFSLDVGTRVDRLDVSQRQMVEIAKGIAERPRILVLDEPSAVLSRRTRACIRSHPPVDRRRISRSLRLASARRGLRNRRSRHGPQGRRFCHHGAPC